MPGYREPRADTGIRFEDLDHPLVGDIAPDYPHNTFRHLTQADLAGAVITNARLNTRGPGPLNFVTHEAQGVAIVNPAAAARITINDTVLPPPNDIFNTPGGVEPLRLPAAAEFLDDAGVFRPLAEGARTHWDPATGRIVVTNDPGITRLYFRATTRLLGDAVFTPAPRTEINHETIRWVARYRELLAANPTAQITVRDVGYLRDDDHLLGPQLDNGGYGEMTLANRDTMNATRLLHANEQWMDTAATTAANGPITDATATGTTGRDATLTMDMLALIGQQRDDNRNGVTRLQLTQETLATERGREAQAVLDREWEEAQQRYMYAQHRTERPYTDYAAIDLQAADVFREDPIALTTGVIIIEMVRRQVRNIHGRTTVELIRLLSNYADRLISYNRPMTNEVWEWITAHNGMAPRGQLIEGVWYPVGLPPVLEPMEVRDQADEGHFTAAQFRNLVDQFEPAVLERHGVDPQAEWEDLIRERAQLRTNPTPADREIERVERAYLSTLVRRHDVRTTPGGAIEILHPGGTWGTLGTTAGTGIITASVGTTYATPQIVADMEEAMADMAQPVMVGNHYTTFVATEDRTIDGTTFRPGDVVMIGQHGTITAINGAPTPVRADDRITLRGEYRGPVENIDVTVTWDDE
jgi:hypothetical protein